MRRAVCRVLGELSAACLVVVFALVPLAAVVGMARLVAWLLGF